MIIGLLATVWGKSPKLSPRFVFWRRFRKSLKLSPKFVFRRRFRKSLKLSPFKRLSRLGIGDKCFEVLLNRSAGGDRFVDEVFDRLCAPFIASFGVGGFSEKALAVD